MLGSDLLFTQMYCLRMQKSSYTLLRDTSSQINAYCCNQQSIHFFKAYIHLMSDDACFIKTRCRNKFLTQKEVKYVIIVVIVTMYRYYSHQKGIY